MKRLQYLLILLLAGVVTTLQVQAHGPSYSYKRFIQFFDQNHDGIVTLEEFNKGSILRYKKMDKNGDGIISKAEFDSYYANSKLSRREQKFKKVDTNNDGKLSFDEYLEIKKRKYKRRFDRMDANKDGFITLAEINAYKRKLRSDKVKGDRIFMILDQNKDGKISEKESRRAWTLWFKRLDRNHDQKITEDDLK